MRHCKALCGEWLPADAGNRRKYCGDGCRRAGAALHERLRYRNDDAMRLRQLEAHRARYFSAQRQASA